jgi:hypothetical protein
MCSNLDLIGTVRAVSMRRPCCKNRQALAVKPPNPEDSLRSDKTPPIFNHWKWVNLSNKSLIWYNSAFKLFGLDGVPDCPALL